MLSITVTLIDTLKAEYHTRVEAMRENMEMFEETISALQVHLPWPSCIYHGPPASIMALLHLPWPSCIYHGPPASTMALLHLCVSSISASPTCPWPCYSGDLHAILVTCMLFW